MKRAERGLPGVAGVVNRGRDVAAGAAGALRRLLCAVLCAVLSAVLVAGCGAAAPEPIEMYEPASDVRRLQQEALAAPEAGLVVDFELLDGRLYLLEAGGSVVVLEQAGGAWRQAGAFARRGRGPGELSAPTAIGAAGDGLVVAEADRLQFFSREGELRAVKLLRTPCPMRRPAALVSGGGVLLHGTCHRGGYRTDTLKSVLAWSSDTASYAIIAEDVQLTLDGSVGSAFGARYALTAGTSGEHAFGSGTTNCFFRVRDNGTAPAVEQVCPAAEQLFRSDPPPGMERRLRARAAAGTGERLEWPETLPPFVERIVADGRVVLVRPFSPDSVVLQPAGAAARDLAVAPLNGFIGCKAAGCLWLFEEAEVPHVFVLTADRLAALLNGAQTE